VSALTRACASGALVTHPSPYATRCPACELKAQRRWFGYLATLPELRRGHGGLEGADVYVTGAGMPGGLIAEVGGA
jgi:hypothetical protein